MSDTQASRMTVLTLGQKKGGAGKTTTSMNVAAAAAQAGWRTLYVDLDDQSPTLLQFDVQLKTGLTLAELLKPSVTDKPHTRDVVHRQVLDNLDLLCAHHDDLDNARLELEAQGQRAYAAMINVLEQVQYDYDLAVIDTPPVLGGLQELALIASDFAIATSRANSLEMPNVLKFYNQVAELGSGRLAPQLKFLGLVLIAHDARAEETTFIEDQIAEAELPVFGTRIPESRLASKGLAVGQPAVLEWPTSAFAVAYKQLTAEVLSHITNDTRPPLLHKKAADAAQAVNA